MVLSASAYPIRLAGPAKALDCADDGHERLLGRGAAADRVVGERGKAAIRMQQQAFHAEQIDGSPYFALMSSANSVWAHFWLTTHSAGSSGR